MKKQKFLLANWKQNGDEQLVHAMFQLLNKKLKPKDSVQIGVFPPFVYLPLARHILSEASSFIKLGAQNLSAYANGAFTGEISAQMLKEVGVDFVLVGHSERRHIFGETNQVIAEKFNQALNADLIPVLCLGETERQYSENQTEIILLEQLNSAINKNNIHKKFMIAYEPVWAIGTGKSASPETVQNTHAYLRNFLSQIADPFQAESIPLLYGGSVNSDNISSLLSMPDINGALIGGASLKPESFLNICSKICDLS